MDQNISFHTQERQIQFVNLYERLFEIGLDNYISLPKIILQGSPRTKVVAFVDLICQFLKNALHPNSLNSQFFQKILQQLSELVREEVAFVLQFQTLDSFDSSYNLRTGQNDIHIFTFMGPTIPNLVLFDSKTIKIHEQTQDVSPIEQMYFQDKQSIFVLLLDDIQQNLLIQQRFDQLGPQTFGFQLNINDSSKNESDKTIFSKKDNCDVQKFFKILSDELSQNIKNTFFKTIQSRINQASRKLEVLNKRKFDEEEKYLYILWYIEEIYFKAIEVLKKNFNLIFLDENQKVNIDYSLEQQFTKSFYTSS